MIDINFEPSFSNHKLWPVVIFSLRSKENLEISFSSREIIFFSFAFEMSFEKAIQEIQGSEKVTLMTLWETGKREGQRIKSDVFRVKLGFSWCSICERPLRLTEKKRYSYFCFPM